jgi:anaerobic carbon-monoxide dehydrogenase iron sulfur subunit
MKRIMVDKNLCTGCLNCSFACMAEHNEKGKGVYDLDLQDPKNSSRNFISLDLDGKPTPIFCRHCDEPECVISCMSGAMTKYLATGLVSYDATKCAACFMCIMSCPYGVLSENKESRQVIVKCDFCGERSMPRCVENCPTNALYLIEVNKK